MLTTEPMRKANGSVARNGQPDLETRIAVTYAPSPRKKIWPSETCPDQPVSTTTEVMPLVTVDGRPAGTGKVGEGEGLVARGVDVTLFATAEGKVRFTHHTRNKKRVSVEAVEAAIAAFAASTTSVASSPIFFSIASSPCANSFAT